MRFTLNHPLRIRSDRILMGLDLRAPMRVMNAINQVRAKREDRAQMARANAFLEQLAAARSTQQQSTPPAPDLIINPRWKARQVISTVTDVSVIALGPDAHAPHALLKLANSGKAASDLQQQSKVLSALRSDPRLAGWQALLPSIMAQGEVAGQYYVMEAMLPGVDARRVLRRPDTRQQMLAAATQAIGELHQRTATMVRVNQPLLHSWIDDRLKIIHACLTLNPGNIRYAKKMDRLKEELYLSFAGKEMPVGWIHGDFGPGNILVTPSGEHVTGMVDWGLASPEDLPPLDLVHLLLSTRMYLQGRELGDIIRRLLNEEAWTAEEQALFAQEQRRLPGEWCDMRALLILAWLRHIASNLNKSPHYANHWLWVTRNIKGVIEAL